MLHRFGRKVAVTALSIAIAAGAVAIFASAGTGGTDVARGHQTAPRHHPKHR